MEEPSRLLAEFARAGRAGLVRAGRGLPVVFGRAARAAGLALVTVLPSRDGMPGLLDSGDRRAAGELLLLSEHVRLLEYDPSDRDACVRADEDILKSCGRLLAVWDRLPHRRPGRDGPPGGLRAQQRSGRPHPVARGSRPGDAMTTIPRPRTLRGRCPHTTG